MIQDGGLSFGAETFVSYNFSSWEIVEKICDCRQAEDIHSAQNFFVSTNIKVYDPEVCKQVDNTYFGTRRG